MLLFNRHACMAWAVLVRHAGHYGSDGPVAGCSHSWPFPWMSSFWFNWKLGGGPGHSCALWRSQDWSPVGKWVRLPWCQPKLLLTFLPAPPPELSGRCFGDGGFPALSRWWLSPGCAELLALLLNFSVLLAQPEGQVSDGLGEWVGCTGKHLSNESRGPRDIGCLFF